MPVASKMVAASASFRRRLVTGAFLAALAALLFGFGRFLVESLALLRFPGEIDYGEGIVWEQMRLMLAGRGYGAIDGLPAIVFHYPPVYHMATAGLAAAAGLDPLVAGRTLSLGATLVMALLGGLIAAKVVRTDESRRTALLCGAVAALAMFSFSPIVYWGPLMRVDMLAIALSLAGLFAAMTATRRPWAIHASALLFVGAVYTKQTQIVAPAAVFLTFLLIQPRLAWRLLASCVGLGLMALATLGVTTDGGFFRHILLYNANRFDAARLVTIVALIAGHLLIIGVVLIGMIARGRAMRARYRSLPLAELRERLGAAPGDGWFLLTSLYALLAFVTTFGFAKSGSNVNYFIEWLAALAILLGIVMRDAARVVFGSRPPAADRSPLFPAIFPLLIAAQAFLTNPFGDASAYRSAPRLAELARLEAMVGAARRPVISDDMVVLRRAGSPIFWEPAIFAELASTGTWDERPFVARIRGGQFAFFITARSRGDTLFDSRYTPNVADAIDAAYPVKRRLAGYVLHLPESAR